MRLPTLSAVPKNVQHKKSNSNPLTNSGKCVTVYMPMTEQVPSGGYGRVNPPTALGLFSYMGVITSRNIYSVKYNFEERRTKNRYRTIPLSADTAEERASAAGCAITAHHGAKRPRAKHCAIPAHRREATKTLTATEQLPCTFTDV